MKKFLIPIVLAASVFVLCSCGETNKSAEDISETASSESPEISENTETETVLENGGASFFLTEEKNENTSETDEESVSENVPDKTLFQDDRTLTVSEDKAYGSAVYYAENGELNKSCAINGGSVTVSWDGEEEHKYQVKLFGDDVNITENTYSSSYTFESVTKNKFGSCAVGGPELLLLFFILSVLLFRLHRPEHDIHDNNKKSYRSH